MNEDKLSDYYHECSRIVVFLIIVTVFINGYLIQRSYDSDRNINEVLISLKSIDDPSYYDGNSAVEKLEENILSKQQGSWFGLSVKYVTLSILWPIVMSVFYLVILYYLEKRNRTIGYISEKFPEFDKSSLKLSPYSLEISPKALQLSIFAGVLVILPILGYGYHAHSSQVSTEMLEVWIEAMESGRQQQDPRVDNIVESIRNVFQTQLYTTIVSLIITLLINAVSIIKVKRTVYSY